jgi:CRP/FNR family transcriptional regulator, cyclic AMP receptor protein
MLERMLSELPDQLLTRLFANSTQKHVRAGDLLFAADDPGDGCYRLERGLLKVYVTSEHGVERIIAILGPGAIVGELSMIDGQPRSASVVALSDSVLSYVTREAFIRDTKNHPEIQEALVTILSARLRETVKSMAATSFLTVKGRVARALLDLAKHVAENSGKSRVVLKYNINQADLAAMAGVARENVSRVMSDWKRRKLVTRSAGFYCIHDINRFWHEMYFKK